MTTKQRLRRPALLAGALAMAAGLIGGCGGQAEAELADPGDVETLSQDLNLSPLSPKLECIENLGSGFYRAHFGYDNTAKKSLTVPIGALNFFVPRPLDQGQPRTFSPGRHKDVFSVRFNGRDGWNRLAWWLGAQRALATQHAPTCAPPPPECASAADCDDDSPCTAEACTLGKCVFPASPAGTACGHDDFCNGAGQCVECLGAADCDDDSPCTSDVCSAGSCAHPGAPAGTVCGHGGACDGAGTCNPPACFEVADCDDDDPCSSELACTAGICSYGSSSAGTPCGHGDVCNGAGSCVECLVGTDCDDDLPCTSDVCTAGTCSHPPAANGTSCGHSGTCSAGVCSGS